MLRLRCWRCGREATTDIDWLMLQPTRHSNDNTFDYHIQIRHTDPGTVAVWDDSAIIGLCPHCQLNKEDEGGSDDDCYDDDDDYSYYPDEEE